MKRIFVLALMAMSFASCQNTGKSNTATGTATEATTGTAIDTATLAPEMLLS